MDALLAHEFLWQHKKRIAAEQSTQAASWTASSGLRNPESTVDGQSTSQEAKESQSGQVSAPADTSTTVLAKQRGQRQNPKSASKQLSIQTF